MERLYLFIGIVYLIYLTIVKIRKVEGDEWIPLVMIGPFCAIIIVFLWPVWMFYSSQIEEKKDTPVGEKRECFFCKKDKPVAKSKEIELSPGRKIIMCDQCFDIPEERANLALLEALCEDSLKKKNPKSL